MEHHNSNTMAQCLAPFRKKETQIDFPCGKCYECLARRVSGWSFRLMQEYKRCESAYFVTLTYENENLTKTLNNYKTIIKRDLQLYFKRLRKLHPNYTKIKYYACGEYGTNTKRPHYHIILFNANPHYIAEAWQLGQIHIGEVNEASVGYTLKYMSKKSQIPVHQNDDRQKEFSLMSKRLGANYLTPEMVKWHESDLLNRMYLPLQDGKKIAMPRYFKEKIYTPEERERIGQKMSDKAAKIQLTNEEFTQQELIRINKLKKTQHEQRIKTTI